MLLSVLAAFLLAAAPAAGAAPAPAPAAAAGSSGPPVAIVRRTGRTIRGSALDGSGSRPLVVLGEAADARATPSPDGRRIALVARGRLLTLELDSGVLRDRGALQTGAVGVTTDGPATFGEAVRWSPDGTRIAVLDDDGLAVCGATDAGPAGCARWTEGASYETGATWSPDGTRVAVVRSDLALVTTDGATTAVVERHPVRDRQVDYPSSPVWTRAGLVWSTVRLRLADGELDGVGRGRLRRLTAAGTRTIALLPRTGTSFVPFAIGSELPDGTLVGVRSRFSRSTGAPSLFDLRRLHVGGTAGGTAVAVGPFDPGMGTASATVAGALADGRVALLVRGSERRPARLYLADPGRGLGRRVAVGDEIAVATALPGNPAAG